MGSCQSRTVVVESGGMNAASQVVQKQPSKGEDLNVKAPEAPSPTATMAFPESSKATIASRKENTANAINNQNVGTGNDVQPGNYGLSEAASNRPRFASYASGASTPECNSDIDDEAIPVVNCNGPRAGEPSSTLAKARFERKTSNPKALIHSSSKVGLDEMIEDRRETGHIGLNVVHIEVPFGKPIEEVYDGVHNGPVLGSGISGLVRLVTHKATGIKYAVKVLDLGLLETAEGLNQLREEIFIMCQLDHPNIVRLEEVYESQTEIYLVQELCLGGELFDRLDEQPDYHYTEGECARLVKQMLSAVRYLHKKGIIHRDLKLENFLFSSTAKDSELKMIDFGLSKHFRYGEVQHEAVGTPYTVSPEVIRGSYDERCDVWAIGVITFLLLSGDPPFGGCGGPEPLMQVRSNILNGSFRFEPEEIWENVSSLARSFIRDLLKTDPRDRPTARQAQMHQWLQEWASRGKVGKDNVLNPNVVKALVNFKEFSDMRKLLCEVLSFTLLPYQIKDLRREFEKVDTDGSGEISLSALKQVLVTNAGAGSLGALTEEEVVDIFNAMRVRKTETRIHWHEFIAAGLSQCQVDDRNLRLAFDRLDSDHKGYIVLDDIMDLMGSDAFQSEDALRRMWGESMKAVKCQYARITYEDFLLLMKGQTRENHAQDDGNDQSVSISHGSAKLSSVNETIPEVEENRSSLSEEDAAQSRVNDLTNMVRSSTPTLFVTSSLQPRSAPTTPSTHKKILDPNLESPLSMDEDIDITYSGPGVPGLAASLTPPSSPSRGAKDYITPCNNRTLLDFEGNSAGPALPGFVASVDMAKPSYSRGRSRSLDEKEQSELNSLSVVADVVRDMLLPETDQARLNQQLEVVNKDESKSALAVNRKLYRAHRHMRLGVLEASKRFEEQQAEHAKRTILAAREAEGEKATGIIHAGLVMRHGHTKQVSSQTIRKWLEENRQQQQALVEKANRRGGRGRRSRKKTTSDMSGMLNSLGQDEMTRVAMKAAGEEAVVAARLGEETIVEGTVTDSNIDIEAPFSDLLPAEGPMRGATVPGEFRKTYDPFGSHGKYGVAIQSWTAN